MKFHSSVLFGVLVVGIAFSTWLVSQSVVPSGFGQRAINQEKLGIERRQGIEPTEFEKDLKRITILTESRNMHELLLFAEELKEKWANDRTSYSRLLAEISNSFSSYDFRDKRQYIHSVDFAKKVLQKPDDISIQLEYEMVVKLQSTSAYFAGFEPQEKWGQDRAKRIGQILHLWKRIEKNIDRTFDITDPRNRPLGNVPVPGPFYPPGIYPEDIREPEIRAKYTAAIAVNRKKADKFNLQVQLQKLDKVLPEFVERIFVEFYSLEPKKLDELEANMRLFGLGPETRQRVLDTVKPLFETQK